MREIAAEIWRSGGADARPEQERIVSLLSRDQAIRSLLELQRRAVPGARRAFGAAGGFADRARRERARHPRVDGGLRGSDPRDRRLPHPARGGERPHASSSRSSTTSRQTFEHLDERDRVLTEDVLGQVKEHGELVARETTRLVEVDAGIRPGRHRGHGDPGDQRVEEQAEAFATQDLTISEHVGDMVAVRIRPVAERLELSGREGRAARARPGPGACRGRAADRGPHQGLAQLIRSDSEAIRRVVEERSEDQVEALREAVDWRMAAFAERIDEQLERAGDQVATRASEAAERAIADSLGQTIERMSAGVGAIDGLDSMMAEGRPPPRNGSANTSTTG